MENISGFKGSEFKTYHHNPQNDSSSLVFVDIMEAMEDGSMLGDYSIATEDGDSSQDSEDIEEKKQKFKEALESVVPSLGNLGPLFNGCISAILDSFDKNMGIVDIRDLNIPEGLYPEDFAGPIQSCGVIVKGL